MGRYNDLVGDPTEYNPDSGEGNETTENVPEPDDGVLIETQVLDSYSTEVSWDGDTMWMDCPFCGDRLCATWFYNRDTQCDGCGSEVEVKIRFKKVTEEDGDD